jgi:hypothetical protein
MGILDDIIKEIKPEVKGNTEQIREICRQIAKQETMVHKEKAPEGANVFLTLEMPPRRKHEITYLFLEREAEDRYIAVYSTMLAKNYHNMESNPKRVRVYEINEFKPKVIMREFAKIVKILRGE